MNQLYPNKVIRDELFSSERLEEYAIYLANELKVTNQFSKGISLLPRLKENNTYLSRAYDNLSHSFRENQEVPPAAEWLVDNFHIVEDQIREILQDLPAGYYNELPKLNQGNLTDYPRVYAIALTLVAHQDSRLEIATIERFVRSFQTVAPLLIGEIWAIAISLRIALVENLRRIIEEIQISIEIKNQADQILEKLFKNHDRVTTNLLISELETLFKTNRTEAISALVHLLQHLNDNGKSSLPIYHCIEKIIKRMNLNVDQLTNVYHQMQAAQQVTTGNIVSSMRLLSSVEWQKFFEDTCLVEKVLNEDPAQIYHKLDSETKDRCRHVIERIGKKTKKSEIELVNVVKSLAQTARNDPQTESLKHHVGYYLIENGVLDLEKKYGYQPSFITRLKRSVKKNPNFSYFSILIFLTIILLTPFFLFGVLATENPLIVILVMALALIPSNDVALNLTNLFFNKFLRPNILPGINFKKNGVPPDAKTFIVIPTLFSDIQCIHKLIERLTIHFLGNRDQFFYFALLSDFTDSDHETENSDRSLLEIAQKEIEKLNLEYGNGELRFFIFHRNRTWNPSERKWMGWERKRGKIHQFNLFLRDKNKNAFTVFPSPSPVFSSIKYVITLDSDTQLPRDAAKKLLGKILHPFNQPRFNKGSKNIVSGYGILQPRISISPESSNRSIFSKIFSGHTGIDPYTKAVSDTYQDLYGQGSYTGKGLYVLDAFEKALSGVIPENTLLSHDLFEGLYSRVALCTDVELLDDYPYHYEAYSKRQARWTRGDWQLLKWLLPYVRNEKNETIKNELSLHSKWKIFDNLRRSIVAPSILLMLAFGWITFPSDAYLWTAIALGILITPSLFHAGHLLISHPNGIAWTSHFWNVGGTFAISMAQLGILVVILVHQSYLQLSAVLKTLFRVFITHSNLLQWTCASEVEASVDRNGTLSIRTISINTAITLLVITLILIISTNPLKSLIYASPFLMAWLTFPFLMKVFSKHQILAPVSDELTSKDKQLLFDISKNTWNYFETFVSSDHNGLPPDNYQELPSPKVANRTSPTNIGMYLLSCLSAFDLKLINVDQLIERVSKTLKTVQGLPKYKGHLFNWYDTNTLNPLPPKYISTVDSGNLAGHLIALKQGFLTLSETVGEEKKSLCLEIANACKELSENMNFSFLFDLNKQVFAIGYNVDDNRADNSFYDLLASESRLASFFAIAKGDVPQEHWFQLGRQLTQQNQVRILISWSASMFEYLMPLLVMKEYPNTLLFETHRAAVNLQIKYRNDLRVPWGVSEAGYNARDLEMNYQYGPFGVPGLGLKRGLQDDLVVSPYSTALAALIFPKKAIHNFKRLISEGVYTSFGFYESIDYTSERLKSGQKKSIVKSFMTHHQGMILVSLSNVLHNNLMSTRFHSDLSVKASELLLQERIPKKLGIFHHRIEEVRPEKQHGEASLSSRKFKTFNFYPPITHLLSNGETHSMVTTAGTGYTKFKDIALNRFNPDPIFNQGGIFIYLQDQNTKATWSATFEPTRKKPDHYETTFTENKAEFFRKDYKINTHMEIVVSPEDHVELRRITLRNDSNVFRSIDITSYLEPALMSSDDDAAHPVYNKLFIQTEEVEQKNAVLARKRSRSGRSEEDTWAFHVLASSVNRPSFEIETDRSIFIGRGRNLESPTALDNPHLSNTSGTVLDPILSIRTTIHLNPGETSQICFSSGFAKSRLTVLQLIDRYHDISAFEREESLSWTRSQVQLRHFSVTSKEAERYQTFASHLIFSNPYLRHHDFDSNNIENLNQLSQTDLWTFGIGGDLPIVLTEINNRIEKHLVEELLEMHQFLRLKGVIFELVILISDTDIYRAEVADDIQREIRTRGYQSHMSQKGGLFLLQKDQMSVDQVRLLRNTAHAVLSGRDGNLKRQLNRASIRRNQHQDILVLEKNNNLKLSTDISSHALKIPPLQFFNGTGGFSKGGSQYTIVQEGDNLPPLPWSNSISNKTGFGVLITEAGGETTWAKNSRENRLTQWSNDPIIAPSGEAIYLKDLETEELWSPTPWPIRHKSIYLCHHSQGFSKFEHHHNGIKSTLTTFVTTNSESKIQTLRLKNVSTKPIKLAITRYVEWVLGNNRTKSAHHIVCENFNETVLVARNPFNSDFGNRISFSSILYGVNEVDWTCSREEFFGANASFKSPTYFHRSRSLPRRKGPLLDPCAVLSGTLFLEPGEEKEIAFILGQVDEVRQIEKELKKFSNPSKVNLEFENVKKYWDNILSAVQIQTPDESLNLLVNRWLPYQILSCRIWGRTAFFQSGGAYGFRDQLQDTTALMLSAPNQCKEQILLSASRQFTDGDVQHWWHPPSGKGVRTRCSDDLLWLPYTVAHYVQVTGDSALLDSEVPYLEPVPIPEGQEDLYYEPKTSERTENVFQHCCRAIEASLKTGAHGLPFIGTGDWNDGMNGVGPKGRGESVWLGWFLISILRDFSIICQNRGEQMRSQTFHDHAERLIKAIESNAWDGNWYLRAFYDDGSPLGSASNSECQIDSIAQSWAVLSKAAPKERCEKAMNSVKKRLFHLKNTGNITSLFAPAFDQTDKNPGYIKGYVPGVRENGGQYTHAATWVCMAYAELGLSKEAFETLNSLNPVLHTSTPESVKIYQGEPYVTTADIYTNPSHFGRSGWTWYTGSAAWTYRTVIESILGMKIKGDTATFSPCIPEHWKNAKIKIKYKETNYHFELINEHHSLDIPKNQPIRLVNDKKDHYFKLNLTQTREKLDSIQTLIPKQ